MKTTPIVSGCTYHIYNRGNNGGIVFPDKQNYAYFELQMSKHLLPIADIYAYCLIKNHYHLLLRIKDEQDLPLKFKNKPSLAISNLLNGYTKAINKSKGRTGSLFEKNFERKKIEKDEYFRNILLYIHCNPVHHGICNSFLEYSHSSVHEYKNEDSLFIDRSLPLNLFDGKDNFFLMHTLFERNEKIKKMDINY